jgi:hypothetical protein
LPRSFLRICGAFGVVYIDLDIEHSIHHPVFDVGDYASGTDWQSMDLRMCAVGITHTPSSSAISPTPLPSFAQRCVSFTSIGCMCVYPLIFFVFLMTAGIAKSGGGGEARAARQATSAKSWKERTKECCTKAGYVYEHLLEIYHQGNVGIEVSLRYRY